MKIKFKKLISLYIISAIAIVSTFTAQAGVINDYLVDGVNLLEDGSGEVVMRFDGNPNSPTFGQYLTVTSGLIQQSDLFLSVFDINWINNAANVLDPFTELTGVSLMSVASITDITPAGSFFTGDIQFSSVDPILVSALLGVTASAGDTHFFFEDIGNNLSIITDDASTGIANATDGTKVITAGITSPNDYFNGEDVYLDLESYSALAGIPGVSLRGALDGGLSISQYQLAGTLIDDGMCSSGNCYDMVVSGSLLVSELDGFSIQNDAQFSYAVEKQSTQVPEPTSLILFALGLLGIVRAKFR